eukprot:1853381-Amphidinium_carterae.1
MNGAWKSSNLCPACQVLVDSKTPWNQLQSGFSKVRLLDTDPRSLEMALGAQLTRYSLESRGGCCPRGINGYRKKESSFTLV